MKWEDIQGRCEWWSGVSTVSARIPVGNGFAPRVFFPFLAMWLKSVVKQALWIVNKQRILVHQLPGARRLRSAGLIDKPTSYNTRSGINNKSRRIELAWRRKRDVYDSTRPNLYRGWGPFHHRIYAVSAATVMNVRAIRDEEVGERQIDSATSST